MNSKVARRAGIIFIPKVILHVDYKMLGLTEGLWGHSHIMSATEGGGGGGDRGFLIFSDKRWTLPISDFFDEWVSKFQIFLTRGDKSK